MLRAEINELLTRTGPGTPMGALFRQYWIPAMLAEELPDLPNDLREVAVEQLAVIGPPLPGGEVYTDDIAPVEWLIDKSIVDYAAGADD